MKQTLKELIEGMELDRLTRSTSVYASDKVYQLLDAYKKLDPLVDYQRKVKKRSGYPFPGIVVSTFFTITGNLRYVVECTAAGVEGCLHIFSPEQLTPDDDRDDSTVPTLPVPGETKSLARAIDELKLMVDEKDSKTLDDQARGFYQGVKSAIDTLEVYKSRIERWESGAKPETD